MSTILKTLKKLEEEKSVLDKKVDLKGLVLQEDRPFPRQLDQESGIPWRLIGGVLLFSLAGVAAFYFLKDQQTPNPPARAEKVRVVSPEITIKPVQSKKHMGIPLKKIPSILPQPISEVERNAINSINEKRLFAALHQAKETYPPALEHISTVLKKGTDDPILEEIIPPPRIRNDIHIPGLKVKGIIFFSQGNPVNHALVSTPKESNLKLKVNDSVSGATLQTIHPNRLIFDYKNELIVMSIGE